MTAAMKALPRERIALVVFMACIALLFGGIVAYLFAGHSWNVAANHIDDAAGELEGYHVLLYEGTSIPVASRVNANGQLSIHPVSLAAIARDYRQKGASVFVIRSSDLSDYDSPVVFEHDGFRVGVVRFPDEATIRSMRTSCKRLQEHSCDTVLAICKNAKKPSKVEGIDILLTLDNHHSASPRSQLGFFQVHMPAVGSVGVVLISPSDVASTRIISHA